MVKMRKKCKILPSKKKKYCVSKPYVIYKLDGNANKNFLISKYAGLTKNEEMMSKIIKLIKEKGNRIYGTKFPINIKTGKLIYRSKDGLYGLWKSNLNKCFYLLLYVDYGEIKGSLKKWAAN